MTYDLDPDNKIENLTFYLEHGTLENCQVLIFLEVLSFLFLWSLPNSNIRDDEAEIGRPLIKWVSLSEIYAGRYLNSINNVVNLYNLKQNYICSHLNFV